MAHNKKSCIDRDMDHNAHAIQNCMVRSMDHIAFEITKEILPLDKFVGMAHKIP